MLSATNLKTKYSTAAGMSGLYAPAESDLHTRTWMMWPTTSSIYGGAGVYYEDVKATIGRLASAIAAFEPVFMLADKSLHEDAARHCGPNVTLLDIATDDMWARDAAPVFLRNTRGQKALLDLNFNGWGGKQKQPDDVETAKRISALTGIPRCSTPLIGEGGGLEYDGEGTLILTESCWVNDNRNAGRTRAEIEAELKICLGVEKVIWLPGVRGKDITDGHVDGTFRIARPGLIIGGSDKENNSEWSAAYAEGKAILARSTDAKGRAFTIVEIPNAINYRSRRPNFFPGYANYYVGNNAVFTPSFGDEKADTYAQQTLKNAFPTRKIVVLELDRIYENGGGIHCVTQQEPA